MMKEEIQYQRELLDSDTEPELQLIFSFKPGYDRNRYNLQRTNEVAVVFVTTADGDIPESYVTIHNKAMYGHLIRNHIYDEMSSSVILAARNIGVNEINKTAVSLLDSYNEFIYLFI